MNQEKLTVQKGHITQRRQDVTYFNTKASPMQWKVASNGQYRMFVNEKFVSMKDLGSIGVIRVPNMASYRLELMYGEISSWAEEWKEKGIAYIFEGA